MKMQSNTGNIEHEDTHTRSGRRSQPRRVLALVLPLLTALGCPDGDPDQGGSGGTDGPQPTGQGHKIQCCFSGTIDGGPGVGYQSVSACEQSIAWDCIDPVDDDTNDNGTLDADELRAYCKAHCAGASSSSSSFLPWEGNVPAGTFLGCEATSGVIKETFSCGPSTPEPYDYPGAWVPTHDVIASSSGGGTVDIHINREPATPTWGLSAGIGLYECDAQGIDGGTCTIALRGFQVNTTGSFTVGDFSVTSAAIDLVNPEVATIAFSPCSGGTCTGTFELSPAYGNSLDANLSWDQVTISTGSLGGGYLLLSNGRGGLGGLDPITGTLTLDASGASGTLRLLGSGSDRLGNGDYASLRFDITGTVSPYSG